MVAFVEQDEYCQKVLKKHWADVPIINDIRDYRHGDVSNTVRNREVGNKSQNRKRGRVEQVCEASPKLIDDSKITTGEKTEKPVYGRRAIDLLTGGFPCQPFSVAGKRKGKKDDRYLWPEMLRIIREMEPTWIIGENVRGIVNMALDEVLADLESAGYSTTAFVIPACAVNAPHRRDRVWIVAHPSGEGLQRGEEARNNGKNGQELWDEQFAGRSRVEGWDKFPTVAPVCGRDDGVPDRVHRLKALGNAVVPQIPFSLFEMIKEVTNDYQENH